MKCREMMDSLPCGKVVAGDGRRRDARFGVLQKKGTAVWVRCREVVYLLFPYGKGVTGDRWRCGVRIRVLQKGNGGIGEVLGGGGFAFLRESHAGYKAPPALCQEPAFESTTSKKKQIPKWYLFLFGGRWWIRTTEVIDDRFTVCSLWPLGKPPVSSCPVRLDSAGEFERTKDTQQSIFI